MTINATPRRTLARLATLMIAAAAGAAFWAPAAAAGESDAMGVDGIVFADMDGDGLVSPGEPGIEGLSLSLVPCPSNGNCEATTDADGRYEFGFLHPQEENVQVVVDLNQGGGWEMSDQNFDFTWDTSGDAPAGMAWSVEVIDEPGATVQRDLALKFTEEEGENPSNPGDGSNQKPDNPDQPGGEEPADPSLPTIEGFVWDDKDRDGIQDKGEKGLANREVTLEHESDMKCKPNPDCTVKTDDKGNYSIQATGGEHGRIVVARDLAENDQTDRSYSASPKGKGDDRGLDSDVKAVGEGATMTIQSDEIVFAEGETTEVDAGLFNPEAGSGSGGGEDSENGGGLPVTGVGLTVVIGAAAALLVGGIVLAVMARRRKRIGQQVA